MLAVSWWDELSDVEDLLRSRSVDLILFVDPLGSQITSGALFLEEFVPDIDLEFVREVAVTCR
jgi:hypothetical protein